jgi:hypothetical protein
MQLFLNLITVFFYLKIWWLFHFFLMQGIINITSTYDSRTHDVESSLVARGDLWRVEASQGSSTSGNESSSLFLVQLGPVLFVRDTTLLLPVHLSKQHLLWYGYDRKVWWPLVVLHYFVIWMTQFINYIWTRSHKLHARMLSHGDLMRISLLRYPELSAFCSSFPNDSNTSLSFHPTFFMFCFKTHGVHK